MRSSLLVGCFATLLLITGRAEEKPPQQYGSVTGQFVLDGKVPPRRLILKKGQGKDPACCAKEDVYSEELIVDEKTKGIANVYVYLPRATLVHPRLAAVPKEDVIIDQKGCRFVPHTAIARDGQTIRLRNSDRCLHSPQIWGAGFVKIAAIFPAQTEMQIPAHRPKEGNVLPATLTCSIHFWMKGYVLVLDHPYGTVTDAAGRFTIKDLSAGDHVFQAWQEKAGWIPKELKVRIEPNRTTDLGTLKIPSAKLDN